MGTNFYLVTNPCPNCGRHERQHIGKLSMGWQFLFDISGEIKNTTAWIYEIMKPSTIIEDEYGKLFTGTELLGNIILVADKQVTGREHNSVYSWADYEFS